MKNEKEEILFAEVKKFVKNKLQNVKSVDQIPLSNFKCNNMTLTDNVYDQLYIHKKLLQLMINIYNYYDTYKDFRIKLVEVEIMDILRTYYRYDKRCGTWRCIKRPGTEQVEEYLYNYLHGVLSIQNSISSKDTDVDDIYGTQKIDNNYVKYERNKSLNLTKQKEVESKKSDNNYDKWKCGGCDSFNNFSEDKCGICETKFEYGTWSCGACKIENKGVHDHCNGCNVRNENIKNKGNEDKLQSVNIDKREEIIDDLFEDYGKEVQMKETNVANNYLSKLKNVSCKCMPGYTCETCCEIFGNKTWVCGHCKKENKGEDDHCNECNVRNENIKDKRNEDKLQFIKVDKREEIIDDLFEEQKKEHKKEKIAGLDYFNKWKCGRCECLNYYTFINCEICESVYKDGIWVCGKCKKENSCGNENCDKCGDSNVNIKVNEKQIKLIDQNKDDDVKIGKDEWKCGHCGLLQSFDFIDCEACGESRGVKGVWKCDKCTMINKCDNINCKVCYSTNNQLGERDHLQE